MQNQDKIQKLEKKAEQLNQQINSFKQEQNTILEELMEEEEKKIKSETDPDYYEGYDPDKIKDLKEKWEKLEYKTEDLINEKDEIIGEIYDLENPQNSEKIECSNCGKLVDDNEYNDETDSCKKCSKEILGEF